MLNHSLITSIYKNHPIPKGPKSPRSRYTDKEKMIVVNNVLTGMKPKKAAFLAGVSITSVGRFIAEYKEGGLK